MEKYKITRGTETTPKVFLTTLDGFEVEAVTLNNGETYYLSFCYGLQEKGYKRLDTCRVAYVDYCGATKLVGLFLIERLC